MHFQNENRHMVDVLFVLSLFCVFAFSALMLVMIGADVYKKTASNMDTNYASRISYAYLSEKIRQNDRADSFSIGTYGGSDAFMISEEINGTTYYTYLYQYDGKLRELFTNTPDTLNPGAGQAIMDCSEFSVVTLDDHLFCFSMTTSEDVETTLYVSTRCAGFTD